MASPTRGTWVWVDSGSRWWTGRPGVLWFTGSQRVWQDLATEQQTKLIYTAILLYAEKPNANPHVPTHLCVAARKRHGERRPVLRTPTPEDRAERGAGQTHGRELTGVLVCLSVSSPSSSSESLAASWQLALAGETGSWERKAWRTRRYTSSPSSESVPWWDSHSR